MYTFQDYLQDLSMGLDTAVKSVISHHKADKDYMVALDADNYDHQQNTTISNYVKTIYTRDGRTQADTYSLNSKLCSNFFTRLNTQRMTYSLGNGVDFEDDSIKAKLGVDFDTKLRTAGYYALIHGVSFMFWNVDHVHVFPLTEFAPLWDEETGALRAGIRYWQIDDKKPIVAILYEEDGFTRLMKRKDSAFYEIVEPKRPYRMSISQAEADAEPEIVAEENYSELPIIPVYASRLKQSTLIGMKGQIDAYDLIRSGFANDLNDCSEIYWIITNAGGMDDKDLLKFRNRLKNHVVNVEDADGVNVTPYTQELPYTSRKEFLADLRSGIYEDFGALDIHTISAGATNDHIDAGYQPLDENADDYEYEIIQAVQNLLRLQNIDATPIFKRNRVSNQKETVEMVMSCRDVLDDETILSKLPFITTDEVKDILERKDEEDFNRWNNPEEKPKEPEKDDSKVNLDENMDR